LSPLFSPVSLPLAHPPHSTKASSMIACPSVNHDNITDFSSHSRQHPSTQHQHTISNVIS
jgi:phage terminase large subunit-like protein